MKTLLTGIRLPFKLLPSGENEWLPQLSGLAKGSSCSLCSAHGGCRAGASGCLLEQHRGLGPPYIIRAGCAPTASTAPPKPPCSARGLGALVGLVGDPSVRCAELDQAPPAPITTQQDPQHCMAPQQPPILLSIMLCISVTQTDSPHQACGKKTMGYRDSSQNEVCTAPWDTYQPHWV